MKKFFYLFTLVGFIFVASGCNPYNNAGEGAATGGALGMLAGGIIGHQSHDTGAGMLIGGAVGAVTGAAVGSQIQKPEPPLLKRKGINVAIGSSSKNTEKVLKNLGIYDMFPLIVDGKDVAKGFPSKKTSQFYVEVAKKMGIDFPGKVVVIEDSAEGVKSARAGGIGMVIGLARDNDEDALREAGADVVTRDVRSVRIEEIEGKFTGFIFDMDGVLAQTNLMHYQTWKETLNELMGKKIEEFTFENYKQYMQGMTRQDGLDSFVNSLKARGIDITDKPTSAENGGIDLNQINVKRKGKTVNVQFDPAQLNELMQGGFEGFTPVIINITPIQSPLPLLGPDKNRSLS
ncbi:MAG: HAD hydrolase-like protein [Candidatus Omnitrophica bacterium]|nr:HAD hydrolase-like protein [Candidatus Omnitrophota bacterium]